MSIYSFAKKFFIPNKTKNNIFFQKIQESNDLKLCAIYPVTLNIEEKSMGGITCQGGMMAGNYLFIQNTIKEPNLRLSEISAFGYEF